MSIDIVRYRAPHARVAVAYSTKDRTEHTRLTVAPLLAATDIDLYWFDGSTTDAGRRLPFELCPLEQPHTDARAANGVICEVHLGVVGGPDCAILYALQTLRQRAYDLVVLIENDVLVADGWYAAMRAAIERAEAAGFKVGGATARLFAQRVLSFNNDYCLMLNSGAGCIALRPEAIDIVLAHYRTLDAQEFFRHVRWLTGIDASATLDIRPRQQLCVDFIFDLILYLHGYVVAAPPKTFARTLDEDALAAWPVRTPGDHLPVVQERITRPEQIRSAQYRFFRFQQSPQSDRLLIGCHQLQIGVNGLGAADPVRTVGSWRRIWRQFLGPFGLLGAGEISVQACGLTTGVLFQTGPTPARIFLSNADGSRSAEVMLEPSMTIDFPLWEADGTPIQARSLHVSFGEICLIGLTVNATVLSQYARAMPSIDHLPA